MDCIEDPEPGPCGDLVRFGGPMEPTARELSLLGVAAPLKCAGDLDRFDVWKRGKLSVHQAGERNRDKVNNPKHGKHIMIPLGGMLLSASLSQGQHQRSEQNRHDKCRTCDSGESSRCES